MTVMPLPDQEATETGLNRGRTVILISLCAMFVAAWGYLVTGAGMGVSPIDLTVEAGRLSDIVMKPVAWSLAHAVLIVVMWLVLTIAIIAPSATPIVMLHATENRKRRDPVNTFVFAMVFLLGYLAVWGLFSIAATAAQWTLTQASLMSKALSVVDARLLGAVFIAAGIYQFAGVKQASLRHMRHPDKYIFAEWRDGIAGAARMGFSLGTCLLGSCWLLVGLLFAGGILNVLWIAGLSAYIMLEKLSGHGRVVSIMFGCALTCWGIFVLGVALRP